MVIYGLLFAIYPLAPQVELKYAYLCVAFGDGVAPLGSLGGSNKKTLTGSLLCFAASLAALTVYGCDTARAVIYSLLCTIVEMLSGNWDNLAIFVAVYLACRLLE